MSQTDSKMPTVRVPAANMLPDQDVFTNRFQIKSLSSTNIYIVEQHKDERWWKCSCPGWGRHNKCKHLSTLGLPILKKPYEVSIVKGV